MMNLRSDNSRRYAFAVLTDFAVAFLGVEDDKAICPFFYCCIYTRWYIIEKASHPYLSYFRKVFYCGQLLFFFSLFVIIASSYFHLKCVDSIDIINFSIDSSVIFGCFPN